MKTGKKGITRREFLTRTGMASTLVVAGFDCRSRSFRVRAASDRVRIALVGMGHQGMLLLRAFMKVPEVEIAALCDIDELALRKARAFVEGSGGRTPIMHSDLRRILDDKSIDAISIATPNHWHALMGIWACQAGKDCYIESPCSHTLFEGQQLVSASKKYGRLVQYGRVPQLAGLDPVTVATLGPIHSIRTICFSTVQVPSATTPLFMDERGFDLWLGPARPSRAKGLPLDWRKHANMHNGLLGFFALGNLHQAIHLLGGGFPVKVSTLAAGRRASLAGGLNVATQMEFEPSATVGKRRLDLELLPQAAMPRTLKRFAAEQMRAEGEDDERAMGLISQTTIKGTHGSYTAVQPVEQAGDTEFLVQNFVAAIRDRHSQLLASPIEAGHVACGALHLANASLRMKRPVFFNPVEQTAEHDPQTERLILGSHRRPYIIPKIV
jgi:predicted dehydrogenase